MATIHKIIKSYLVFKTSLVSQFSVFLGRQCTLINSVVLLLLSSTGVQSQVLINSTAAEGNFEGGVSFAAAGWTVANAGTNRWWTAGTPTCTGTNAAYVGSLATNNTYVNTNNISYFYRSIVFPAGQTCITLSFNWKGSGQANVDGLVIYVGSVGGPVPVGSTAFLTTDPTALQIHPSVYAVQTVTCASVSITLPSACAGTTRFLVFSWQNNNVTNGGAGATVDDIGLVASASVVPACATGLVPANLSVGTTPCNPVLSWTPPGGTLCAAPTSYDIHFGTATNPPLLANTTNLSYALDVLNPLTTYYWKVVPRNAAGAPAGCVENRFTTGAAACPASPGGVGLNNVTAWFKSDALAAGDVTSWTTSYPTGGSAISVTDPSTPYAQSTNSNLDVSNSFNYNQYISFAGNSITAGSQRFLYNTASFNLMANSNVATDQSSFFTAYLTNLPDPLTSNDDAIVYWQPTTLYYGMQCRAFGRFAIGRGIALSLLSSRDASSVTSTLYPTASVFSYTGNRFSNTSMSGYYNGAGLSPTLASESQGGTGLGIGIHIATNTPTFIEPFVGDAAEHIFYNATLSAAQATRVHTYMAVKYGTTLTTNYVSSNNTTIYTTASPYNNNIIGIGRDDNSGLTQKQSHNNDDSVRFYLGTLAATNVGNGSTFLADQSFLMTGANTGLLNATPGSMAAKPASIFSRLERQWKVTKTNFNQTFSMDIKLALSAAPLSVLPSDLRLLVTPTGNFATATVYAAGGGLTFTYSYPTITVSGISALQLPNNSTQFITIGSINATTPLPVQLVSFWGQCVGSKAVLSWSTASEQDLQSFGVERSVDGATFASIGSVKAQGTSSSKVNYSYSDGSVSEGIYYYRLKQVDGKGIYHYSTTVQVKQNCWSNRGQFSIHPNPVKDNRVQINYTADSEQMATIKVTNNTGHVYVQQVVRMHAGENKTSLVLGTLSAGIYFMHIESAKQRSKVVKIIISPSL